jgi:hypothetical protein
MCFQRAKTWFGKVKQLDENAEEYHAKSTRPSLIYEGQYGGWWRCSYGRRIVEQQ